MMQALRGAMMGGGKKMPYDYEVDWIQGDGTSYVDTGLSFSGIERKSLCACLEIDITFGDFSTTRLSGLGSTAVIRNFFGYVCAGSSSQKYPYFSIFNSSGGALRSAEIGKRYSIKLERKDNNSNVDFTVDGSLVSSVASATSTSIIGGFGTFRLFVASKYSDGTNIGTPDDKTKIHSVKISNYNTGISKDLIPVCKDGIGYFYDRISGDLLGNSAGAGSLVIGPRI